MSKVPINVVLLCCGGHIPRSLEVMPYYYSTTLEFSPANVFQAVIVYTYSYSIIYSWSSGVVIWPTLFYKALQAF